MKRKKNLYKNICKMENIEQAYKEVCKNTRNERRVFNMKQYKSIYISRVYNTLKNKQYKVGPYNKFTIFEPKERLIVSQGIQDKIINHLVARYILYPAILPCLIDSNVASRKNMGTRAGIEYEQKFIKKCNNSNDQGLYIGSMANQALAIFYLNDFDKFVKAVLKVKYYVRYQDDILLFHESKEYLKFCFAEIKSFLEKEKLILNNKSRIYKNTDNFMFLGRNTKGKYIRYRNVKRKIKAKHYLYNHGKINLYSFYSSINCYSTLLKRYSSTLLP